MTSVIYLGRVVVLISIFPLFLTKISAYKVQELAGAKQLESSHYSDIKFYPVPRTSSRLIRIFIGHPLDVSKSALIQKASFGVPMDMWYMNIPL